MTSLEFLANSLSNDIKFVHFGPLVAEKPGSQHGRSHAFLPQNKNFGDQYFWTRWSYARRLLEFIFPTHNEPKYKVTAKYEVMGLHFLLWHWSCFWSAGDCVPTSNVWLLKCIVQYNN